MLYDDGDRVVGVKVEEVTGRKEEEDPQPATSAVIKTEPAVSCMSVCVQCYAQCTDTQSCLHLCRHETFGL
jgi:hypothetical protein